jgi:hypothetical protein
LYNQIVSGISTTVPHSVSPVTSQLFCLHILFIYLFTNYTFHRSPRVEPHIGIEIVNNVVCLAVIYMWSVRSPVVLLELPIGLICFRVVTLLKWIDIFIIMPIVDYVFSCSQDYLTFT